MVLIDHTKSPHIPHIPAPSRQIYGFLNRGSRFNSWSGHQPPPVHSPAFSTTLLARVHWLVNAHRNGSGSAPATGYGRCRWAAWDPTLIRVAGPSAGGCRCNQTFPAIHAHRTTLAASACSPGGWTPALLPDWGQCTCGPQHRMVAILRLRPLGSGAGP